MKIELPKNTEEKNVNADYYFVVDMSGSMWGSIKDVKDTLLSLKTLLKAKDTLSLAYFSGAGDFDWIVKGASLSNNTLDRLISEKVYARGATCYTEVLESVGKVVNDVSLLTGNRHSVMYFLSDGWPNSNSPESKILQLCDSLKDTLTTKTVVGYSNNYNRNVLLQMAEKLGGQFSHVNGYKEIKQSCAAVMSNVPSRVNVKIDRKYDLVWQVAGDIFVLAQNKDNSVDAYTADGESSLFAVDFAELDSLTEKNSAFVYSLAYVLSQKNKANLGVSVLRKAGASNAAKDLQKAFTVAQKGNVENNLKTQALVKSFEILPQDSPPNVTLVDFLAEVKNNVGKIAIDIRNSDYSTISRSGGDISKVAFEVTDELAKIVGVTGNEDRANVSFLTVREGEVTGVTDIELASKIVEHNKSADKKIEFPIKSETYRNYTFVANGDFNFETLVLTGHPRYTAIAPEKQIDLFDESVKEIKIGDFVNLYKALIKEKAHASVLRFYVKKYSDKKHLEDLRETRYGKDAVVLLEEMGLDYRLRYAPKKEYKKKEECGDYIPFTEISAYLKGASTISASDSFKKFEKKGKLNVADGICWPLFENYENMLKAIGEQEFVEYCQSTLEGLDTTIDRLSQKISMIKFYLIITNSWFDSIPKADEFEHDGLVIKVKEVNEYL